MAQTELLNQLQTLWQHLSPNPRNRALAIAHAVTHHGDAETIRLFTGLIERQTPPGDEREQALMLLANPQPVPPKPAAPTLIASKASESAPSLEDSLETLWHELAGNPRHRAVAIAHMVVHHGGEVLCREYAQRIEAVTPFSDERIAALKLLRPSQPFSHIHITDESLPSLNPHLPVDPELARLTIVFDCAAELRLWVVARQITRDEEGSGVICKKALKKALKSYGVSYTPRHINRLLKRGEGLFWSAEANQNIYIRSWINVGLEFARKAAAQGIELDLNKPGVRQMLLDVSGSLEHWEAAIYAGWISHRDGLTIARVTLSQLFGRDPNTIRRWEAVRLEKAVTIRRNYVQCGDVNRYFYHLPDHTTPYVARYCDIDDKLHTVVRLRWQIPNSYSSSTYSTAHRGQAAKVRKAVNAEYPPYQERGGQCEMRYLMSRKKMKRLYHSLKFRMGLRGDVDRAFYVFLGEHYRTGQGIFEITNSGFLFTDANERLPIAREKDYLEGMERQRKRDYNQTKKVQEEAQNGT